MLETSMIWQPCIYSRS